MSSPSSTVEAFGKRLAKSMALMYALPKAASRAVPRTVRAVRAAASAYAAGTAGARKRSTSKGGRRSNKTKRRNRH